MVANACWWVDLTLVLSLGVICWWFGLVVGCVCSSWGSAACCVVAGVAGNWRLGALVL